MAHFALVNRDTAIVQMVVVVGNEKLLDAGGVEKEALGVEFLKEAVGPGWWVQTSYNGTFRKNYAGVGYKYDQAADAFYPAEGSFPSWVLDTTEYRWRAPVAEPTDGKPYQWDETQQVWVDVSPGTVIDNVSYTLRFTGTEQQAIEASTDANVAKLRKATRDNPRIRLNSPQVVKGVNYLESIGLIAAGRAAEILTP